MPDTELVTQLVHEKDEMLGALQRFQAACAVMVLNHGKKGKKGMEYRLPKAALDKLNHQVTIRNLKTGGLVVTVIEGEDE